MKDNPKIKKAWQILEASGLDLDTFQVLGFDALAPDSDDGPYIIGDWNEHDDLGRALEAAGCEIVFSDDHTECSDCGGCIETEPSWFGWTPRYIVTSEGDLCDKCAPGMWRVSLPEAGKVYLNTWDNEVNGSQGEGGAVYLCDLPVDFDYDAVDEYLESDEVKALIVLASHGDEEALGAIREGIAERADPLPPLPDEVDDAESWQFDYFDGLDGWQAFVVSLDFDPECSWGADEGDDRTERERMREARELPWHACMSLPGCLDTSCHVRGRTSKEALHALAETVSEWAPSECTEAAYIAAKEGG